MLSDDDKHHACWASLTRKDRGKKECLVGDKWRCECEGCPYELESKED